MINKTNKEEANPFIENLHQGHKLSNKLKEVNNADTSSVNKTSIKQTDC